jgi:Na+/proline symporter
MMFALQTAALPPLTRPAIVIIALLYFAIVAAIGVWATRRTRTARDFFVAGRGIGLFAMTMAAMAASLSGFAFIGGPGLVYTLGLGAVFIVLPASLTNTMGAWVLAKRMRLLAEARNLYTVPAAIGARYRSPAAQGLAAISILIAIVGYMAANILALGLIIDAIFGIGLAPAIWIGTAVTLAYSAAGGILAGIYTDVFQGALMAVASALVFFFALDAGGGMAAISTALLEADPQFLAPWGKLTPIAALSFFFVFGIGALGQPHVVHKFFMLRDPLRLKYYPLLMTAVFIMTLLLFFGVGVAVKTLVVSGELTLARADDATPVFLLRFTPVILAALVFSGVVAAIMSTVNSFMNVGAAAVTHDLPVALGYRVSNELRWGRVSTIIISVLAALMAHNLSTTLVVFLGLFGWGLFSSTLVPALAIGLNWQGATPAGAIASIVTGITVTLIFELLAFAQLYRFPAGVAIAGVSLVLSILVFFAVSLLTRDTAAASIDEDVRVILEV